jgi:hypothetical protein
VVAGGAALDVALEPEALDRHRASVDPSQQPLALELVEVTADRLGRDRELRAGARDLDASGFPGALHEPFVTLDRVHEMPE